MRNELEHIELIEKYLRGELSTEEKASFEEQLKTDVSLQKEVNLQKDVVRGIERLAVKQTVQKSYKKYKLGKTGLNFGLGIIVLTAIISTFLWFNGNLETLDTSKNLYAALNEDGENSWADADKNLPSQFFTVNTSTDTVIETTGGIVMYIPTGSFLDNNGNTINGEVEFEVKEALNTAQIIQGGLSSKSGDRLLESAGMFYINARKDGKTVQINPDNGIYTEVPTDKVNPKMQLFEGKRMDDGTIDWINPTPLEKFLTPVDINSLNFYPPKYESKLAELNQCVSDKKYKDSLYYSFAWENYKEIDFNKGEKTFEKQCTSCHSIGNGKVVGPDLKGINDKYKDKKWLMSFIKDAPKLIATGDKNAVKIFNEYNKVSMPPSGLSEKEITEVLQYIQNKSSEIDLINILENVVNWDGIDTTKLVTDSIGDYVSEAVEESINGINPAKIKAIWSDEFNNTLIATREFEERLPSIFGTCNDKVLDLYINNINLDMHVIDSMAANITSGQRREEFLSFASRKDGKVQIDEDRVQKLQKHYEQKQKLIAEAVAKTQRKFNEENARLNNEVGKTRNNFSKDEIKRKQDNYVEEFNLNLTDAYRQLGKPKPERLDAEGIYRLTLKRGGWKNVDAYVMESLNNRETLDYTDPETGKKAVIKYEPITVSIKDEVKFDRLLVYVLPDKLNSFMRLKKEGDKYTEKLNELMKHNLVCLGYIGEQAYFYSLDGVEPKDYKDIKLLPLSQLDLKHKLNRYDNTQRKSLLNDFDYQLFEAKENIRQTKLAERQKFREEIMMVIFPCGFTFPKGQEMEIIEAQ